MLTIRQIEVLRAIMVTGSIAGAARLLNVAQPGISRLMKYTESSLNVRLFDRRAGRYAPTPEARHIFDLLDSVHRKIDDLQWAVAALGRGHGQELSIASVPSIANVMVPRAIARLRTSYPELALDINILKIEEAIDYLLLAKGEVVTISSRFEHPLIEFERLASGRLICIVPKDSALADRKRITPAEMAEHQLVGIDPTDPYGSIMASMFAEAGLSYQMTIKARFGTTVCSLVAAGLGIAIIDEFTVAHGAVPGLKKAEVDGGRCVGRRRIWPKSSRPWNERRRATSGQRDPVQSLCWQVRRHEPDSPKGIVPTAGVAAACAACQRTGRSQRAKEEFIELDRCFALLIHIGNSYCQLRPTKGLDCSLNLEAGCHPFRIFTQSERRHMSTFTTIATIVVHTPVWVWGLYALLLFLGCQRTRDGIVPPWRMLTLPVVVACLAVASILTSGPTGILAART